MAYNFPSNNPSFLGMVNEHHRAYDTKNVDDRGGFIREQDTFNDYYDEYACITTNPQLRSISPTLFPSPRSNIIQSPQQTLFPSPPSLQSPFSVASMLSPTQVYQQGKSAHDFKVSARGETSTITKPASNTTNHPQTPPKTLKSKKRLSSTLSPTVSPSNKASKNMNLGKKGEKVKINRERWTHDEVIILLEVYKKWAKKLRHDKKKGTWALVKKQYTLRCKQENVSSKKDLKQIQDKISHLTDQHKRVKDNSHSTGRGRMTFKYYSQMSEILDQRQSVVPRNLSEVLPTKKISSTTSRASIPPTITTQATEPPTSPPQGTANFDEIPASPPQGTANFDELSGQEDDTEVNDSDTENDMEMENTNPEGTNHNNKKMTKEGALKDLVTTLKSEMAKQTAEIRQQNENFQKAADADRVILEKLADGYQAECEANAKLASALTDFMNRN